MFTVRPLRDTTPSTFVVIGVVFFVLFLLGGVTLFAISFHPGVENPKIESSMRLGGIKIVAVTLAVGAISLFTIRLVHRFFNV